MRYAVCLFSLCSVVMAVPGAYAACSAPAGEAGVLIFNTDHSVMQYCNGSIWVGMSGGGGGGDKRISGEIAAFDLPACPDGWSPYAPSSGRFLRGRCLSGETCHDPDGTRTAGGVQADDFKSHTHAQYAEYFNFSSGGGSIMGRGVAGAGGGTSATGGAETRPKNVAVLYCRKN